MSRRDELRRDDDEERWREIVDALADTPDFGVQYVRKPGVPRPVLGWLLGAVLVVIAAVLVIVWWLA